MDFEWDPAKATNNFKKHRVSFFEATEVFGDPLSITVADPDHSATEAGTEAGKEERLLIFGQTILHKYLVVSFMERDDRIRLISAREMTRKEQAAYEQK